MVRRHRCGFTLVETVVVLVLVGVLVLLGMFGYRSIRKATDAAAASALSDRVAAVQDSIARDWGRYSPYAGDITAVGSDIRFAENGTPATSAEPVSMVVGVAGTLGLAVLDGSGMCHWYRFESLTRHATKHEIGDKPASAPCTGTEALGPSEQRVPYTPGGTIKTVT